ncbi:MAG: NAD(P)H-quinone oxidoreductase [Bacteroidota bacterium]
MNAILFDQPGDPSNLYIGNFPTPNPSEKEILAYVKATALNRADTLQRRGFYPPPTGASPILGLEMAGEVVKVGNQVQQWKEGDRVMALLAGGGYAEYACVHEDMAMEIPKSLDFQEAAAIPEVFLTAYQALFWLAQLKQEEQVLIHAGASGVGTAAIQLAKSIGAEVFVTASKAKHATCLELGASKTIDYKQEDFSQKIAEFTQNQGVDVVVDFLAASYLSQNVESLSYDGRLVILALMGGSTATELDLGKVLRKRLKLMGSTLRARDLAYKIQLSKAFYAYSKEKLETGEIKPIIDSILPWDQVEKAHKRMESNQNIGKIVLTVK